MYYKVVANQISFQTVCITLRFILVFRQFNSIKFQKFNFSYPFFDFGGHFDMKKLLLTYAFLIFFQNPREIFFKMVLLSPYLFFYLKSGKILFRCRFYQIFFVFCYFLQKLFSVILNMVELFKKNNFS